MKVLKLLEYLIFIVRGNENIEEAKHQRDEESHVLEQILQIIDSACGKMAAAGRQPWLLFLLSDGSSSQSIWTKWGGSILDKAAKYGAEVIVLLNLGNKLAKLKSDNSGEYRDRVDSIMKLVNSETRPALIVTTNSTWTGGQLLTDENSFDSHYTRAIYIMDRIPVCQPAKDDWGNVFKVGKTYTISKPWEWVNYTDFSTKLKESSYMFAGKIKGGAATDIAATAKGFVVISTSKNAIHSFSQALKSKLNDCKIMAYAHEEESKRRIPFLPQIQEHSRRKRWGEDSLQGFAVAELQNSDVRDIL